MCIRDRFPLGNLPTWLTVLTRVNPMTYAVEPLRHVVFARLSVSPADVARFDPGIGWGAFVVPTWLEIVLTIAFSVLLLGLAVGRFRRTD